MSEVSQDSRDKVAVLVEGIFVGTELGNKEEILDKWDSNDCGTEESTEAEEVYELMEPGAEETPPPLPLHRSTTEEEEEYWTNKDAETNAKYAGLTANANAGAYAIIQSQRAAPVMGPLVQMQSPGPIALPGQMVYMMGQQFMPIMVPFNSPQGGGVCMPPLLSQPRTGSNACQSPPGALASVAQLSIQPATETTVLDDEPPKIPKLHRWVVTWPVPENRFRSKDRQIVSKSFHMSLGVGHQEVPFKIMIKPTEQGGYNAAKGKGYIQLKCEDELSDTSSSVTLRVKVGSETPFRGPVICDFGVNSIGALPKGQDEWEFQHAADESTRTVVVCLEVVPNTNAGTQLSTKNINLY